MNDSLLFVIGLILYAIAVGPIVYTLIMESRR